MSSEAGHLPSPEHGGGSPTSAERQAFADAYDGHAAHVFDYCHAIVGNRNRAAAATQATLIAAHLLSGHLREPDRFRAWLMALARRECQDSPSERAVAVESARHARRELAEALAFVSAADDDVDDGELDEPSDDKMATVRAALQKLSTEQREILHIVYRYEIDTYELPAILGIDAASVAELLTDAEERFTEAARSLDKAAKTAAGGGDWPDDNGAWTDENEGWPEENGWVDAAAEWTDGTEVWTDDSEGWTDQADRVTADSESRAGAELGWLAAVPLSTLPASVWRRTSRVVLDPKFWAYREAVRAHAEHLGPGGFPNPTDDPVSPSFRRLLATSVLLASLLLAPAGLSWAGYVEFSSVAASKAPHAQTVVTARPSAARSPAAASPARIGRSDCHSKKLQVRCSPQQLRRTISGSSG